MVYKNKWEELKNERLGKFWEKGKEVARIFLQDAWWKDIKKGPTRLLKFQHPKEVTTVVQDGGVSTATGVSDSPKSWLAGVEATKRALSKLGGSYPDFALLFVTKNYDLKAVLDGVSFVLGNVPIIGSSTHGVVFTEEVLLKSGVGIALLRADSFKFHLGVGYGVNTNRQGALKDALLPFFALEQEERRTKSLFFLADNLEDGEELFREITHALEEEVVIGGLFAYGANEPNIAVFHNKDIVQKGIVSFALATYTPLGVRIGHGLFPVSPRRITKAEKNILYELDGRPALEVLEEVILKRGVSEESLRNDTSSVLARFQFGIPDREHSGSSKIRLPLEITAKGGIRLAGEVTPGTTLWIMEGKGEKMIETVHNLACDVMTALQDTPPVLLLVLTGLPRKYALGEEYYREIEAITTGVKCPVIGINTMGEFLSLQGKDKGFHNSSVVITAFPGRHL